MADEFDIAVIGGGIAGLTAGLTAARLGRKTIVLTGDILGGHLVSIEMIEGVPGFPDGVPGFDYCPMAEEQAVAEGVETAGSEVTGLSKEGDAWKIATGDGDYVAKAVILATGTTMKHLGVPGEEALEGKGVSHCASCDAPLMRGKTAVVVGGGDSAMQETLTLAGPLDKVIMLLKGDGLEGQPSFKNRIEENSKIELRPHMVVEEILGDDGVTGVKARNTDTDSVEEIAADAVFPFVGLDPVTGFLGGLLPLDDTGRIVTDTSMRTSEQGLLAAGTVRAGAVGRAANAAGDGATAALAADAYLESGAWA